MTQRNIDVMDIIVSKMAEGDKLSKALNTVYVQRHVYVPYIEEDLNVSITELGLSNRTTNALIRSKLSTLKHVLDFLEDHKIMEIRNLGKKSGIELLETILDYCWDHMSQEKRVLFLTHTVEENSNNIREEIA